MAKVKTWRGYVITTPTSRQKIYGERNALTVYNRMVDLWARQAGQMVYELPADQFNQDHVWPRKLRVTQLVYLKAGEKTIYGEMELLEYLYAKRRNATR